MWAEASTPQPTSFPGRLTEVRTPEVATRLQVRLRVGRLTLGLTVADRWECSQATGLPAWRHQDLSTSQPLGHTVSQVLKQRNLYSGTYGYVLVQAGPYVRACTRLLRAPPYSDLGPFGGENSQLR